MKDIKVYLKFSIPSTLRLSLDGQCAPGTGRVRARGLLAGLLCLLSSVTYVKAQTDTIHWMSPVWENRGASSRVVPVQMQITTEFATAQVTITLANGAPIATQTVNAGQPWIVPLGVLEGMTFEANKAQGDKGLLIHSDVPVRAYCQGVSRLNQFFVTLKGRHALGTEFYAGSQTLIRDGEGFGTEFGENDLHFISVMATEDDTRVTITPPSGVVLFGGSTQVEVTLNKHETYLVRNTSSKGPNSDNVANNLTGSHITASKPVAVLSGGQHQKLIDSKDADAGVDQLVPLQGKGFYSIGRQYIIIKGSTANTSAVNPDYATIIGTQDQTAVYVDGSAAPVATIDAGEYFNYVLPGGASDIGTPHYIETSKEAYVYHFSGIRRQELGMVLVPSIECTGNRYIEYSKLGDTAYHNVIHIAAPRKAFDTPTTLTINGLPYTDFDATVNPVPGRSDWATITFGEAASLSNRAPLPGHLVVESNVSFHLSILAGNQFGASYGYLAGFTSLLEILDPRDLLPTNLYVVDTVMQGTTNEHCLEIVSCDEESKITEVNGSLHTEEAKQLTSRCLSYTAPADYAGNDTLVVYVNNRAGIPRRVQLVYHVKALPVVPDTVTAENPAPTPMPTVEESPTPKDTTAVSEGEEGQETTECDQDFAISQGFSPNGDGNNEFWYIRGIECFPSNEVAVYNRWGGLVYRTIGYDNTTRRWNGQTQGGALASNRGLPFGTYYYIVNRGDGGPLHKGYVIVHP